MLYAKVENGKIAIPPAKLPKKYKLPDGEIMEDFDKLSDNKLQSYGWLPVENYEIDNNTQERGAPEILKTKIIYSPKNKSDEEIEEEKYNRKKQEAEKLILSMASLTDQINFMQDVLAQFAENEIIPASIKSRGLEFLKKRKSILLELETNKGNANFEKIIE